MERRQNKGADSLQAKTAIALVGITALEGADAFTAVLGGPDGENWAVVACKAQHLKRALEGTVEAIDEVERKQIKTWQKVLLRGLWGCTFGAALAWFVNYWRG